MKKYFNKNYRRYWFLCDILVWLVCILLTDAIWYGFGKMHLLGLLTGENGELVKIFSQLDGIVPKLMFLLVMLLVLGMLLVITALTTIPVLAAYYGISRAVRRNRRARVQYDVIQNIDYFREEFKELSPADISLLMDLKIEKEKDITATLLSLEQKKWIRIEKDSIVPLQTRGEALLPSEEDLFERIRMNQMDFNSLGQWQYYSTRSAFRAGLLTDNKNKVRLLVHMALFVLAFLFCIRVFMGADMEETETEVNGLLAAVEEKYPDKEEMTDEEALMLFQEQLAQPEMQKIIIYLVLSFLQLVCGLLIFILPIAAVAYLIAYLVSKPQYKRTKKGKILTEELAGMRNFIHDFSNLAEADKEQLALWDNFLVYAVVLEENENIVREIGNIRKVDLSRFDRMNRSQER